MLKCSYSSMSSSRASLLGRQVRDRYLPMVRIILSTSTLGTSTTSSSLGRAMTLQKNDTLSSKPIDDSMPLCIGATAANMPRDADSSSLDDAALVR